MEMVKDGEREVERGEVVSKGRWSKSTSTTKDVGWLC